MFTLPFTKMSTSSQAKVCPGRSDECQPPGMTGLSGYIRLADRAISTVSRIIGPVTSETARQAASANSSRTLFWKFGVMVESTMQTLYPARSNGVDMARIPSGAVASVLESAEKENTIFLG